MQVHALDQLGRNSLQGNKIGFMSREVGRRTAVYYPLVGEGLWVELVADVGCRAVTRVVLPRLYGCSKQPSCDVVVHASSQDFVSH